MEKVEMRQTSQQPAFSASFQQEGIHFLLDTCRKIKEGKDARERWQAALALSNEIVGVAKRAAVKKFERRIDRSRRV